MKNADSKRFKYYLDFKLYWDILDDDEPFVKNTKKTLIKKRNEN